MTQATEHKTDTTSKRLAHKVQRLEHLVARYKHTKSVQSALLQLSELASSVTDMTVFYSAMHGVVGQLLHAENFYVVLVDPQTDLFSPVYFSDQVDTIDVKKLDSKVFERGLTGYVYRSGKSLLCDQAKLEQMAEEGKATIQGVICSHWMGVPLIREHHPIGVVVVQTYDNTLYSESDLSLLEFVSLHLVTAIDRVKQRDMLEQDIFDRTRELSLVNQDLQLQISQRKRAEELQSALFTISQITATAVLMDDFYLSIHEVLKTLIYAENCYIALLSADGNELSFPFYADAKKAKAKQRKLGRGFTEYVISKGEACLINREQAHELVKQGVVFRRHKDQSGFADAATSWLGAPLIINDKVIGVITTQVYDDAHQYGAKELEVLCFVSHHLAVAIHRKLAADQLHRSHDELEDKILTRTQELRQTNLFLKLQVEERKKAEKKLYFEANHDVLTGLPNRKMLLQRLEQAITHKKRHKAHNFGGLFIDLDRFKIINDTMGHHVGDLFLIEVSLRIAGCIRDNDILARLGGDEFVILLDMIQNIDDAEEIAQRIISAVGSPFYINEQEVYSGASIGIAECTQAYQNADELLRDADAAMYQAKNMGRGRFIVFDETMHQQLMDDLNIDQALHQAVKEQLLFPQYHALHNVDTGELLGFEVETCWHHPDLGDVEQDYFAELAESNGLIITIDQQILTEVCKQMQSGGKLVDAGLVCVNVSATHLSQSKSLNQLLDIVKQSDIERHKLCFEFSEHNLLKLQDVQLNALKRIKNSGVSISIKGFGCGVSSLGLLTQNTIDYVKTDRGFTRSLLNNAKNKTLLDTLMTLSLSFNFKVILEGIDSEALQQLAHANHVFIGQGTHFEHLAELEANKAPVIQLFQFA